MTLGTEAATRYEHWRGQWLEGADSGAVAILRFHGLRKAMALAKPLGDGRASSAPRASAEPAPARVIEAAVTLMRRLINMPGEDHHA